MALTLTTGSTDHIDHGTALGNWTAASACGWYYPTSLTTFDTFWYLITGGFQTPSASIRSSVELAIAWKGTSNLLYITNNASLTTNKWWFIGWTVDTSLGATLKVKIYLGDLTTRPTARTFGTTTEGATYNSNSGGTFTTGDNASASQSFAGDVAGLMVWPGVTLTEAQIQQHWHRFIPQVAGCKLFTHYGLVADAASTQPDWSGNGNTGTPTGAVLASHPPLGPLFAFDLEDLYQIAAGGTTYPQSLTAGLTPAGALLKQTARPLTGTVTTAGAILRHTSRALTGSVASAGALLKQTARALTGSVASAGALTAVKTALLSLTGSVANAGTLVRQTAHGLTGTVTTAGALLKQTARALTGTVTSAGVLTGVKTALLSLTGSVAIAGTVTKQTATALAGALTPVGTVTKRIARSLSGALASIVGVLTSVLNGTTPVPASTSIVGTKDDSATLTGTTDDTTRTGTY